MDKFNFCSSIVANESAIIIHFVVEMIRWNIINSSFFTRTVKVAFTQSDRKELQVHQFSIHHMTYSDNSVILESTQ